MGSSGDLVLLNTRSRNELSKSGIKHDRTALRFPLYVGGVPTITIGRTLFSSVSID